MTDTHDFNIENRRYLGCKFKLLDWIFEHIANETSNVNSFCDLFAGTGTVSYKATQLYDKVIINDFLYSNFILYKAFFDCSPCDMKKVQSYINTFNLVDPDKTHDNYFSMNYGGLYFEMKTAKLIGYIREEIERIRPNLTDKEYCVLLASLIYSMDRVANTVGHFESYLKRPTQKKFTLKVIDIKQCNNVEIYREDANKLSRSINTDLVYIDPPYNSIQYSRYYHLYEVLVKWDKPDLKGITKKPCKDNMSEYCRKDALNVFTDLITNLNTRYIVVSYNNNYNPKSPSTTTKLTLEQIESILNKRGRTKIFNHSYSAFNTGKTKIEGNKEYLFITEVDK